jgi:hypothetical protein
MVRPWLLVGIALFLCSCGGGKETVANKDISTKKQLMVINHLKSHPGDDVGVGCYYYEKGNDDTLLASAVAGIDSTVFISLNGVLVTFRLTKQDEIKVNDSMTNYKEEYESGGYKLNIDVEQTGHIDYLLQYEGELQIVNGKGDTVSKKIKMECGC